MRLLIHLILVLGVIMRMVTSSALAGNIDPICNDAKLLSEKLLSDICWECMMPINVAGIKIGSGSSEVPPGASDISICGCEEPLTGLTHPGFTFAAWEPARIMEVVRQSGCAPSLGGVRLPLSDRRRMGSMGGGGEVNDDNEVDFAHFHYYAFPILVMLDLFTDVTCLGEGYLDFDLMYMTEVDPTWNNDELAFFTMPESAVVSNPIFAMGCSVDAMKTTGDWPSDEMFWCMGSWGTSYPVSGNLSASGSWAQNAAHRAAKGLYAMHRRGFAMKTKGDDALCKPRFAPMLPKSQYKMSFFYPVAQTKSNFKIGEPDFIYGAGRNIPGVKEDAVLLLWRWNDCCSLW